MLRSTDLPITPETWKIKKTIIEGREVTKNQSQREKRAAYIYMYVYRKENLFGN
jgi:hypothetical protein